MLDFRKSSRSILQESSLVERTSLSSSQALDLDAHRSRSGSSSSYGSASDVAMTQTRVGGRRHGLSVNPLPAVFEDKTENNNDPKESENGEDNPHKDPNAKMGEIRNHGALKSSRRVLQKNGINLNIISQNGTITLMNEGVSVLWILPSKESKGRSFRKIVESRKCMSTNFFLNHDFVFDFFFIFLGGCLV